MEESEYKIPHTWKREDFLWPLLLVFVYSLFWVPLLNVHPLLSTGDNGRDLYAFWMTAQGKWPFRDYWWIYGPLMPLYYAFWFFLGGVNLVSVRIGLAVNYLLCSVFAYRTLRPLTSPVIAFLSSLAFLSFDMAWSYNHIGTFPLLFLSIFCLWRFFFTTQIRWVYFGTLALVGMALVKANAGIISFVAFLGSLLLYQGTLKLKDPGQALPWRHFIFLPLIFGGLVAGAYAFVLWGLPFDWIDRCLPFRPRYHLEGYGAWNHFKHLVLRFLVWERRRLLGVGAVLVFTFLAVLGVRRRRPLGTGKGILPIIVASLLFFGLGNSAEYFLVDGLIYRFDFWIFPLLVLWMGLAAEWASPLFGRRQKKLFAGLIFFALIWTPFQNLKEALAQRIPERYWDFPHGQAYIIGGPLRTVQDIREGTRFIIEHTRPNQEILALPYEPLYCFLSGRRHALRELHFTKGLPMTEEQEETAIRQLETKQVPYVIVSNRYRSKEVSVGHFGITHARKLAHYISEHYREVQTFGPWETGRASPHAVKVLRRGVRGKKLNLLA